MSAAAATDALEGPGADVRAGAHEGLVAAGLGVRDGAVRIVGPLDLELVPGRPLTLLGESGTGKSLVAQAILGALPPGLVAEGEVRLGDVRLDRLAPGARRALWGRRLTLLPQEPWAALDPTMRAGAQVAETYRFVAGRGRVAAREAAGRALEGLGVGAARGRYPHELSGGMAQRVAFAAAMAGGARAVVADEPTKGLDAPLRDRVAALLRSVADGGGPLLTITHDVALARALGGEVALMRAGRIVERGPAERVLAEPGSDYGRALIAADPSAWPRRAAPAPGGTLLRCEGVSVARAGRTLVAGLDLELRAGERVALVGPSGSGKSSLLDALAGVLAPAAGRVVRADHLVPTAVQKLYQDPPAAFARGLPLAVAMRDLERLHRMAPERLAVPLERLEVAPETLSRAPDAVSGGELQRIALARILALRPAVILADEPTSRLDLVTQRRLMELLGESADASGAAVVLVTHDPRIAARWADRTIAIGGA